MRIGLTNALRLALSGVSGAAEGYGAKQERLKKDEQLRLAQERQARLDQLELEEKTANMLASGFMPEEEAVSRQQAARSAIGSAIGGALASAEGRFLTPPSAEGLRRAAEGAASYDTTRKTTLGGRTFTLPETSVERTERTKRTDYMTKQADEQREQSVLSNMAAAAMRGGRNSEAFARLAAYSPQTANALFERPVSGVGFANLDLRRDLEEEKRLLREREGLSFLNNSRNLDPQTQQAVMEGYNSLKREYPNATNGEIGYALSRELGTTARTENVEARTGLTEKRTETLRSPRSGALPPGVRAPASAAKPDSSAGKPKSDEEAKLDAAFDRYTTQKR